MRRLSQAPREKLSSVPNSRIGVAGRPEACPHEARGEHCVEGVKQGRHEERPEHVRILERAPGATKLGEDVVGARHQREIADQRRRGRDQGADHIGRHDEAHIVLRVMGDKGGHHHRGQSQIERDGDMGDGDAEHARLRRRDKAPGDDAA